MLNLGGFVLSLLCVLLFVFCHYRRKLKRLSSVVSFFFSLTLELQRGIPTLLKRAETLQPTISRLGLNTRHANTVDEATGRLDLNNRAHLQIMCQSLVSLVKQRVQIESQKADFAQIMLWHEQLAILDT